MISIIDYGAGNLSSVKNALDLLELDSRITCKPDFAGSNAIILPGDGSFGFMMKSIRKNKLEKPILDFIKSKKPFLGICLGLQALFEESEESPNVKGLCVFKGKVLKFRKGKVPQIGWNKIIPVSQGVEGIFVEDYVYFVNSYFILPDDESIVSAWADYGIKFASSIQKGNITAMQFHPEKSGKIGIGMLRRWSKCLQKE